MKFVILVVLGFAALCFLAALAMGALFLCFDDWLADVLGNPAIGQITLWQSTALWLFVGLIIGGSRASSKAD